MRYGSVCSGIEAATVAWEPLGWKPVWFSEIEKFPSSILQHRYPDVPNLGDMTNLYENNTFRESYIDLLVGGTPCQSFSVAGLRKGLDDPRGNLCLEFLRFVDSKRPRWFVWENVPGVLSSSGGRDFGSFLGAIQKLGYGFAYRILDAQYFGVPQRRRRVFVVGHLGDWRPAAAVLFEPESLRGDSPTRRKARKAVAALTSTGVGTCGADDNQAQAGHIIVGTLNANGKSAGSATQQDAENGFLVCVTGTKTHALKAEGADGSEDGTGRGNPIIAFSAKDYGADAGDKAPTLRSGGHTTSHANAGVMPAVCISLRGREGGSTAEIKEGASPALRASQGGGDKLHVMVKSIVRRLTPRECERLQGFPDDYTLIPNGKNRSADGPRYKALGNSMAVPCMRWIGERIQRVEAFLEERTK